MEKPIFIYLAVDNSILLKGFEGLILSYLKNVTVKAVNNPKELFETNFEKNPEIQKILIYDSSIEFDQSNLLLHNLIQTYPYLRTIVITTEFNPKRIKFLFNAGIYGVMSPDISADDFVGMLKEVVHGKICLAPKFQELVIKHFCKKEESAKSLILENTNSFPDLESNYVEELFGLTKREKEILCLICNGRNTKEISEELFISLHTAETHRRNLLSKLDVKNTAEMVKVAVLSRLIAV